MVDRAVRFRGTWTNNAPYATGDLVLGSDGALHLAVEASPGDEDPLVSESWLLAGGLPADYIAALGKVDPSGYGGLPTLMDPASTVFSGGAWAQFDYANSHVRFGIGTVPILDVLMNDNGGSAGTGEFAFHSATDENGDGGLNVSRPGVPYGSDVDVSGGSVTVDTDIAGGAILHVYGAYLDATTEPDTYVQGGGLDLVAGGANPLGGPHGAGARLQLDPGVRFDDGTDIAGDAILSAGHGQNGATDGAVRLKAGNAVDRIVCDGTGIGFYTHAPVAQQTGVAVSDAAIHAALVNLGLITA